MSVSTLVDRRIDSAPRTEQHDIGDGGRPSRVRPLLLVAIVTMPMLVVLADLVGRSWTPAGDVAIQMIQVSEVGGSHTPLTGAWSRWGWNHPGPLLFYVLAPFTWVFGNVGALAGAATINLVSIAGCVILGIRRGGVLLGTLVSLVALLLCSSLGPDLWIDPWNPWVGLMPLLCYFLICWGLAERDPVMVPLAVGVGSFIVQSHVGFAPLVGGIALLAIALAWRPRGSRRDVVMTRRRLLIVSLVGVVLWLPSLIEQITRKPGNLSLLYDFARSSPDETAGWATAWRTMGAQLGPPGNWLTGEVLATFSLDASALPAVGLIVTCSALGLACLWRRDAAPARLAGLAVGSSLVGLIATARTTGPAYDYLVRWWWIIGAALWLSIAWSLLCLMASRLPTPAILSGILGLATVLSLVLGWRAAEVELPDQHAGLAVAALGPELTTQLDRDGQYVVQWTDVRTWGGAGSGLYYYLLRHGYNVKVPLEYTKTFDDWHLQDRGDSSAVLSLIGRDDLDWGVSPPPGATVLAEYDPLTPIERRRADELWRQVRPQLSNRTDLNILSFDAEAGREALAAAGVDVNVIDELAALRRAGPAYVVYVSTP